MSSLALENRMELGAAWVQAGRAVKIALAASVTALLIWQERARQRARLSELDDRVLKDMGMTRGDALRRSHKAPWRP